MSLFTTAQLRDAWEALPPEIKNTPFRRARTPGLTLKLETFQPTGSYKIRAAYTKLHKMMPGVKEVALSSSGNFAAAFTWAAARCHQKAHLVVTPAVNREKMRLAQEYPCTIHVCGTTYESRFELLENLRTQGVECIDHRSDEDVFLGHSTIGWECLGQTEQFERILIPVSTGGLAIGVAAALREGGYEGEILGVQAAGNPTLYESWRADKPIAREGIETICDALTATSVPSGTFECLQELLDGILLVEEESILKSVGFLALEEGVVAEPGACVGIAALLESQRPWKGSLCLLSGRNLQAEMLTQGIEIYARQNRH